MSKKDAQHKLDPTKIEIRDFQILEGSIQSPFEFDISKVKDHEFSSGLNVGFALDHKLIKTDFSISVATDSNGENEKEAEGKFVFTFIFQVDNLDELTEVDENQEVTMDYGLANAISSITYSTSRGILMTRFQGTALRSFILPVIDPNELL
ncbi:hypothetical protein [Roseivirga sp.]|uniref:hypothetical protein n=1 Tax=Roseivirga sp. TaxID=1964215 RepID=UPI003B526F10